MDDHPVATVRALLSSASINPPEAEVERLAELYPALRRAADRFHDIDVGDGVTAALFRADEPESR